MKKCLRRKLAVCALRETKLNGNCELMFGEVGGIGCLTLRVGERGKGWLLQSMWLLRCVVKWKEVSTRLMRVRAKIKRKSWVFRSSCGAGSENCEKEREYFWNELNDRGESFGKNEWAVVPDLDRLRTWGFLRQSGKWSDWEYSGTVWSARKKWNWWIITGDMCRAGVFGLVTVYSGTSCMYIHKWWNGEWQGIDRLCVFTKTNACQNVRCTCVERRKWRSVRPFFLWKLDWKWLVNGRVSGGWRVWEVCWRRVKWRRVWKNGHRERACMENMKC